MSLRPQIRAQHTVGNSAKPPRPVPAPLPALTLHKSPLIHEPHSSATIVPLPLGHARIPGEADWVTPRGPGRRDLLLRTAAVCALAAVSSGSLLSGACAASLVDEDIATAVFQTVSPCVASVAVIRPVGGVQVREVIGSGVVWDAAGPHVLTNFHILPPLQGTSTLLEVTLTDATTGAAATVGARVAGTDSIHDLAVLRLLSLSPQLEAVAVPASTAGGAAAGDGGGDVDGGSGGGADSGASGLPAVTPIRLGSSLELRVGQSVYALGCISADPNAPARTMSAGLVSGLDRSIPSPVGARIYGVVQTDAIINAANSGGPLVDSFGRLVGLSTAMGAGRAGAGRGSGVNFALPVDLLRDLVPKIIVYGNPYGKK